MTRMDETLSDARGADRILTRRFLTLATMEFLERFAVSGVKSLLVLLFVDRLLVGDLSRIVGATVVRQASSAMFGPVSTTGLASQLYGYANALLYLAVPIGGLVGDVIASRRAMVAIGGIGMLLGLTMMLREPTFLIGLVPLVIGAGLLKGNLSAQVGLLFQDEAQRRRGYTVYLGFLNAGAICGPLICGALAAYAAPTYAIVAAAAAVAIGLALYGVAGRGWIEATTPVRPPQGPSSGGAPATALLAVALASVFLCYSAYDQLGNIFLLWARERADRQIYGWTMPVAWFLALDGIFTLALIAASGRIARLCTRWGIRVGSLTQIFLGGVLCAVGYLVLALGDAISGGAALGLPWTLPYLLFINGAIVLIWPSALSLITEAAPRRLVGLWMGLFYLHGFVSSLWAGFSGVYYDRVASPHFWLLHAALAGVGAVLILVAGPPLTWRLRQAITTSACAKARA
jgi:POT family proton-dependent oligopeptide transporter